VELVKENVRTLITLDVMLSIAIIVLSREVGVIFAIALLLTGALSAFYQWQKVFFKQRLLITQKRILP
jgi:hypothetical protein